MKKILLLIIFISGSIVSSQEEKTYNDWIFKVGVNVVDSRGIRNVISGIPKLDQNAFGGLPLSFAIEKRFNKVFGVLAMGSMNTWEPLEGVIDGVLLKEREEYFAADLNGKVYINELLNFGEGLSFFDIYGNVGFGYFAINRGTFTYNYGAGISVWLTDRLGLDFNTTVKNVFSETELFESGHFLYSAGILVKLGSRKVPNEQVTKEEFVIKDSDSDGVPDDKDYCVNTPGSPSNFGCPFIDSDQDGVVDNADHCPQIKGDPSNNGCPISSNKIQEDKDNQRQSNINSQIVTATNEDIDELAKNIKFQSGNYNFTQDTYPYLKQIASILINEAESTRFKILGHTDSSGGYESNRKLSYMRASAVRNYLVDSGISKDRIDIEGLGESKPIETNLTKEGRAINRRVQILILKN